VPGCPAPRGFNRAGRSRGAKPPSIGEDHLPRPTVCINNSSCTCTCSCPKIVGNTCNTGRWIVDTIAGYEISLKVDPEWTRGVTTPPLSVNIFRGTLRDKVGRMYRLPPVSFYRYMTVFGQTRRLHWQRTARERTVNDGPRNEDDAISARGSAALAAARKRTMHPAWL